MGEIQRINVSMINVQLQDFSCDRILCTFYMRVYLTHKKGDKYNDTANISGNKVEPIAHSVLSEYTRFVAPKILDYQMEVTPVREIPSPFQQAINR